MTRNRPRKHVVQSGELDRVVHVSEWLACEAAELRAVPLGMFSSVTRAIGQRITSAAAAFANTPLFETHPTIGSTLSRATTSALVLYLDAP